MTGLELEPTGESRDADPTDGIDREEVVERIESRAADVRDRQVERALSQCAAHGELTPEQERAVETMAENVVDALLDAPRETVAEADGPERLRTTLDLFDPDR